MRLFRIVADMSLVVIMAVGLQEYYKFLALLYLSVPIATSSRHFGYTILLTGGGSAVILASFFLLEFGPYDHAAVVLTIILLVTYVMTALTIRLEYTDLSQPYLDFVRHYEDSREVDRLSSYLRGTARSINCTGIILVKLFEGGAFFFSENRVPFGRLTKSTAAELGRFISARSENLNLLRLNRPTNVSLHSSIMREIEEILYPPIKGGITAAMAVRVPQTTDVYLIAINPLSRNGATRSQFWITHTVVIRVLALGIGISLNQFIRDRDFRIAGGA